MGNEDLEGTHGLVIPGGESTVILKLLRDFKLFEHVKAYGSSVMADAHT